ncbi:hypothetical protein [Azospirillum himalayense]|uniref:TonB C-terminal domain-containing protein n=1 Tax=Azospirillum himalayense TaxID=654847 RepID=A0ABW0FYB4_9PROT
MKWLAAALAVGLVCWSHPGGAATFDALTLEGAIACASPSAYREAEKAAGADDRKWLESTGCATVKSGLQLSLIELGSQYQPLAKARFLDAGVTAYIGRWHYLSVAQPTQSDPSGGTAKDISTKIVAHLTACAGNYTQPPRGYRAFGANFYIFESYDGVRLEVEAVTYSDSLAGSAFNISYAHRALDAFKRCSVIKSKPLSTLLKKAKPTRVTVIFPDAD